MLTNSIIYPIQYLRAFAAGFVVLMHFTAEQTTAQLSLPVYIFFKQGFVGVDIFFVLSGYIISKTYATQSTTPITFLLRRLARIFSGYWLVILPYSLFLYLTLQYKDVYNPLHSALLIPERPEHNPLPIIWTLYHEIMFYAIFTLLICFPKRMIPTLASSGLLAVCIALGVALWQAAYDTPQSFNALWYKQGRYARFIITPYMAEFAAGVWLFHYKCRIPAAAPLAAVAFICFALLNHYCFDNTLTQGMHECIRVAAALPFATLIVYCATTYPMPEVGRIAAIAKALGNASYSLYLLHMPLFSVAMMLCGTIFAFHIPAHLWAIIGLIVVVSGVAIIWHIALEKPFYRWLLHLIAQLPIHRKTHIL